MSGLRRIVSAVVVAALFTISPLLAGAIQSESAASTVLKISLGILSLPGIIVGTIAANGVIHDVNGLVVNIADFVIYLVGAYFLLGLRNPELKT
jgi:hypothetical protein